MDEINDQTEDEFATKEELETVRNVINEGNLDLQLELWDGEPRLRILVIHDGFAEPLGRIRLQELLLKGMYQTADTAGAEPREEVRNQLFTFAGRLREIVDLTEERALELNVDKDDWTVRSSIEPFTYTDDSDDDDDEEEEPAN
jgi:hypothetical protein